MVESAESKWCPSCGDEYERRIDRCVDCRVDLVTERPTQLEAVRPQNVQADDEGVNPVEAFEVSDLDDEQFEHFAERLEANPIPHQWIAEQIFVVLPGYEGDMAGLLESVRGTSVAPAGPRLAGELLAPRSRGIAWTLDTALVTVVGLAVSRLGLETAWVVTIVLVAAIANHVVGLGERGRSIGKIVMSAKLRKRSGEPLGVGEASARLVIRDAFLALAWTAWFAGGSSSRLTLGFLAGSLLVGLLASVLADPHHRGVHDLMIDSAVYRGGVEADDGVIRNPEIFS